MFCIKCGQELPKGAEFCYKCGQSTPKDKELCQKCGQALIENAEFCLNCGQKAGEPIAPKKASMFAGKKFGLIKIIFAIVAALASIALGIFGVIKNAQGDDILKDYYALYDAYKSWGVSSNLIDALVGNGKERAALCYSQAKGFGFTSMAFGVIGLALGIIVLVSAITSYKKQKNVAIQEECNKTELKFAKFSFIFAITTIVISIAGLVLSIISIT